MEKTRSFSYWNNLFRLASGCAKTKPPNATFRKILDTRIYVDTHTDKHYSARFIALQTSLSLQRLRYIDSRLKASKVQESKPRTRFSKSFPALVIVANYGIVLLALLPLLDVPRPPSHPYLTSPDPWCNRVRAFRQRNENIEIARLFSDNGRILSF